MGPRLNPNALQTEVERYKALKEAIAEEYAIEDDECLAETLEGVSTLPDLLAELVRSTLEDRALIDALGARIADMRERKERLAGRVTAKRIIACKAMSDAGMGKLLQPDFSVFVRAGPAELIIADETRLPGEFWIPQAPKLDRASVRRALAGGQEVPGAMLGPAHSVLNVRTK